MSNPAVSAAPPGTAAPAGRRRTMLASIIVFSIAVHVVALALFGLWVVAQYFAEPEAVFEVQRDLRIPPQPPEHKLNMARHQAMAPKPVMQKRLVTTAPSAITLPDLPELTLTDNLAPDPALTAAFDSNALAGGFGGLGGAQGMTGGGGTGSGMTFFGIRTQASRALLIFDISQSVLTKANRAGVPMSKVKDETLALLDNVGIDFHFGLVQMARNYMLFEQELVPATDGNKQRAREWIEKEWIEEGQMPRKRSVVSNPRGFAGVLERAFEMRPDVIFVVSDANFYWHPDGASSTIPHRAIRDIIEAREKETNRKIPIHMIGFQMRSDDKREWRRMTRATGGTIRELD